MSPARTAPAGHAPLRWAVLLLYVQAFAVAVVTAFLGYAAVTQRAVDTGSAVTIVVFSAGLAALLALLGVLLTRRRGWARGPAIVLELLFVPIGYYMVQGGVWWFGVPVMLAGLACAGLLLAPATRAYLGIK